MSTCVCNREYEAGREALLQMRKHFILSNLFPECKVEEWELEAENFTKYAHLIALHAVKFSNSKYSKNQNSKFYAWGERRVLAK